MSYNYDLCVQSIQDHRRKAYAIALKDAGNAIASGVSETPDLEALQQSMEEFASLSKHCPMTPLLWMQYAQDTELLMQGLSSLDSSTHLDQAQQEMKQIQGKKEALESSTGILELALSEFPGCALLHLYYVECLADYVHQNEMLHHLSGEGYDREATFNKLSMAFQRAFESVGNGSHVNEGMIVYELYRINGSFLLFQLSLVVQNISNDSDGTEMEIEGGSGPEKEAESQAMVLQVKTLFERWSQTPMGEGSNDELMQDLELLWEESVSLILSLYEGNENSQKQKQRDMSEQKEELWSKIDFERKKTSSLTNILSSHENDIDVAMTNEGIMLPRLSLFSQQQDVKPSDASKLSRNLQLLKRNSSKWDPILLSDISGNANARFLMGLGGNETFQAFTKYISYLQRLYKGRDNKKSGGKTEDTPLKEFIDSGGYTLICSIYERAVSECPTGESLWVSYIQFLRGEWINLRNTIQKQPQSEQRQSPEYRQQQELSSTLQTSTQRSIRNCPYSINLFELRMTSLGLLSLSNLEPDEISTVVQEASELGFLNHNREAMLYLRLVAIAVVKRRILSIVSLGTTNTANDGNVPGGGDEGKDYDDEEGMNIPGVAANKNKSKSGTVFYKSLSPSAMEEVNDLLEDIRDMYDDADAYLFKSHPNWSEGKVIFWKHRATLEAYVFGPLTSELRNVLGHGDANEHGAVEKEVIKCFEKLVKVQKPAHPDSWRDYVHYVNTSQSHCVGLVNAPTQQPTDNISGVASTIRKTRGLYHRAMSTIRKAGQEKIEARLSDKSTAPSWIGKGMQSYMMPRNYDLALSDLCREYLDFERAFGSDESLSHALTQVRSKLANFDVAIAPASVPASFVDVSAQDETLHGKRKLESEPLTADENGKEEDDDAINPSQSKKVKVQTNLKQPKKTDGVHKVRVGKMEYPAHPYTIHVSNLDKETEDMDLVDVFRTECGPIVHAKILREKHFGKGGHHFHGDSKGAGLVQFEDQQSVEKALEKNGVLEIGRKKVKIHRSHQPAVGLVPAGMHRVNPKGEGKSSKRNMFKKKTKMDVDVSEDGEAHEKVGENGSIPKSNGNHAQPPKKPSTSPSSLSFDVLSFKPRGVKQKPKISLNK